MRLSQALMLQLAASENISSYWHVKVQLSLPLHMTIPSFSQLTKTDLSQGCQAGSLHSMQVASHTRDERGVHPTASASRSRRREARWLRLL